MKLGMIIGTVVGAAAAVGGAYFGYKFIKSRQLPVGAVRRPALSATATTASETGPQLLARAIQTPDYATARALLQTGFQTGKLRPTAGTMDAFQKGRAAAGLSLY